MSPIFKREDGYTFKIYSNEEVRKHIHVIKAENEAKFKRKFTEHISKRIDD